MTPRRELFQHTVGVSTGWRNDWNPLTQETLSIRNPSFSPSPTGGSDSGGQRSKEGQRRGRYQPGQKGRIEDGTGFKG